MGTALTYATITFLAIFLPFLLVPGLVSLLFHELIVLVAVAIGFSRIAASTITPMLAHVLYKKGHTQKDTHTRRDLLMMRLAEKYGRVLKSALDHRALIIGIAAVVFIGGIALFRFAGTEFLPRADDGMIMVKVKMPIGTSMDETYKVIQNIENEAKNISDIKTVSSLTGGSIWGLVTSEIANEGQVDIQLVPKNKRSISTDAFVEKYAETLQKAAKYPGAKVKAMHTKMKGIRQTGDFDVEIEIKAPKTASIKDMAITAQSVIGKIKDVKNLTNIDISLDVTKPEYHILLNQDRISDLGLTVNQVATTARMLIDGVIATYYLEDGYYYPVRVILGEDAFRGKLDIGNIPLMTAGGLPLYLSSIGSVERSQGPVRIDRADQMRLIKVTGTVAGGNIGNVNNEVKDRLNDMQLPAGWKLSMGAQARMMSENFKSLALIIMLSLFFAFVILAIQFESFSIPLLLLIRIPLSLAGISVIMVLTGTPVG
ncbi:MAG: efflux RND transporter permease subunit, partial [Spirochaetota bacterium]